MSDTDNELIKTEEVLRPSILENFTGQHQAVLLLRKSVAGSALRNEAPDHTLISGPPGLGKTTLASILARETGGKLHSVMAPSITRAGDLASILVSLSERDVLFLDEIHRLPPSASEMIYSAMEDFRLDILTSDGIGAQSISIPLPKFCLVGATTRPGMLTKAFRDRFSLKLTLVPYDYDDMTIIIKRSAQILEMSLDENVAYNIALRCRGTPRVANSFLRRIRDHAAYEEKDFITVDMTNEVFSTLGVDENGLNDVDNKYLDLLKNRYRGGPVGLKTLATALAEDLDTVEYDIEPWLIQKGYIERTQRGRMISQEYQTALDL